MLGACDSADEAKSLWDGHVLGLNSNVRIYRYSAGQYFGAHYDEANRVSFPCRSADDGTTTTAIVPGRTTWTLLIYLSTCEGGETVFYQEPETRKGKVPEPVTVEMEVGLGLLHRHGDNCLFHEAKEVRKGEKWVLRSDLVVKR